MPIQTRTFSTQLLTWYEKYGRHDLPWQKNTTPYRVWISEIMLQQTQVVTVIPYFERFMQRFSDIKTLALASEDEVLSCWSGLGYYARARNIHKTAKIIHEKYADQFPMTVEDVNALPGIGQSTAGAIISFSMRNKAVILDGNVKRVLARHFAINTPINQANTMKKMWALATELTPDKKAHTYNQAIMDLGATLCTRTKPRCHNCPCAKTCLAYQTNKAVLYPIKTAKKARLIKKIMVFIIYNKKNEVLLCKRPSKGIWGGLWSFPETDINADYTQFSHDYFSVHLTHQHNLPMMTHHFTHYTLKIFPICCYAKKINALDFTKMIWYKLSDPLPGGVASPVIKIMRCL